MSFTREFDRYLNDFRLRLKKLVVARGLATIAVVALGVTLLAVAAAIRSGFPDDMVIASRLFLLAAIAALIYVFVVRGRRRVGAGRPAPGFIGTSSAFLLSAGPGRLVAGSTLRESGRYAHRRGVRTSARTHARHGPGSPLADRRLVRASARRSTLAGRACPSGRKTRFRKIWTKSYTFRSAYSRHKRYGMGR